MKRASLKYSFQARTAVLLSVVMLLLPCFGGIVSAAADTAAFGACCLHDKGYQS